MLLILQATIMTSRRDDQDAQGLHDALLRLDQELTARGGPHYTLSEQGKWAPAAEPRAIADAWQAIQHRFPDLTSRLRNQIVKQRTSQRTLALAQHQTINLGEQPRHQQLLDQLKHELGARYFAPDATPAYRHARVRKWKEQAQTRKTPTATL
jgi:hypothetical protein